MDGYVTLATFTGGQKFQQAMDALAKKVSTPGTLRVGFFANARYPNGQPVAMVAAIQEYGAPKVGIPPRPFFRTMIAKKEKEWPGAIKNLLKQTNYDVKLTLNITGQAISEQLKQSIRDTNDPALSPVTLMLRKMFGNHPEQIRGRDVAEARRRVAAGESYGGVSTKPLIWTGYMISRVSYEVK